MSAAERERVYVGIDAKSFYASVEAVDRGLDPLGVHLVVANESRTEKTICLAVSPSLKAYGIPGRARLFEVVQKVKAINAERLRKAPGHVFTGKSFVAAELEADPSLELDYIVAMPRMAKYMEVSSQIYGIYLRHLPPENIHVYSIDEVLMDITGFLKPYGGDAEKFVRAIVREVHAETGITATAGIGTNLYLCKIAMDILAKKMPADEYGVRIASLDERSYREQLWTHTPLTDFWRVGRGYARKLEHMGVRTMGDIALMAARGHEDALYKAFGVGAELLIDHAFGWEPVGLADIKAYRPESNSLSRGQVLSRPYSFAEGELIAKEMADNLVYELLGKKLVTDQIVLTVGYDIENSAGYTGPTTTDPYGRVIPKSAHGSQRLGSHTSSRKKIGEAVLALYRSVTDPQLTVRRMYVVAGNTLPENEKKPDEFEQLDLFGDAEAKAREAAAEREELARERRRQDAVMAIKAKYGKNAIVRVRDLEEGATAMERNKQSGGHDL